jgi:hypothetical protein
MLFRETVAVYFENLTEHTDILCGQNAEFWYVKAARTCTNHQDLNGWNVFEVASLSGSR